jgi:hypothetical protein
VENNKNAFNLKAFEVMGYEVGQAFAAYMRGFTAGIADAYAAPLENVTDNSTTAESDEQPVERVKTRIEDCRGCWCNTCAIIEKCIYESKDAPDWHLFPCDGCVNGVRYMPKQCGDICPCDGYIEGVENNA